MAREGGVDVQRLFARLGMGAHDGVELRRILFVQFVGALAQPLGKDARDVVHGAQRRSEEHTSELQSLMRISYAVFCLKNKSTKDMNMAHHPTNNKTAQY